jgi:hypothetical protein
MPVSFSSSAEQSNGTVWDLPAGLSHPASFSSEFKDTVEQIRLCSKKVEGIAKAAERAELRDVHVTVQRGFGDIETRLQEMQAMQAATDARLDTVLQVALSASHPDHPRI